MVRCIIQAGGENGRKRIESENQAICSKIANLKSKIASLSLVPTGTMAFIFVRIE